MGLWRCCRPRHGAFIGGVVRRRRSSDSGGWRREWLFVADTSMLVARPRQRGGIRLWMTPTTTDSE